MRSLSLFSCLALLNGMYAQQEVKITSARALDQAPEARNVPGLPDTLRAAGLAEQELAAVIENGDHADWPDFLRQDSLRAAHAPSVANYVGFRVCRFMQDSLAHAVVRIPAKNNIHMPEGLRPTADLYLVLPDTALALMDGRQKHPALSRGPRWDNRPKAKIIKADDVYGTYDLSADSTAMTAMSRSGMSKPEIDAVVFRSTERNWPEGIDNFHKRTPLMGEFPKYSAYLGASWADKVLLIVPVEKNKDLPVAMRPYMDLYFVYNASAVKFY
ncbi:MAG: hypothetical protein KBH07_13225 [Flavobacteriales bacterium]|nr:hypothetical protein [Flavobacteriales bacterium]MBP9080389.1 hypothetical protein [Flavobacteriales bacterium]